MVAILTLTLWEKLNFRSLQNHDGVIFTKPPCLLSLVNVIFIFEIISSAFFLVIFETPFIRLEGKPLWEKEQCHVSIICIGFPRLSQIILSKLEAGLHLDKFHLLSRTKEPACHLKLAPKRQNKGMSHSKLILYLLSGL